MFTFVASSAFTPRPASTMQSNFVCRCPLTAPPSVPQRQVLSMGLLDNIAKAFGVGGSQEEIPTVKIFVNYGGKELKFRLAVTEKLEKVEEAFYDNTGYNIKLMKGNTMLNSNLTIQALGIQDLDKFDAISA